MSWLTPGSHLFKSGFSFHFTDKPPGFHCKPACTVNAKGIVLQETASTVDSAAGGWNDLTQRWRTNPDQNCIDDCADWSLVIRGEGDRREEIEQTCDAQAAQQIVRHFEHSQIMRRWDELVSGLIDCDDGNLAPVRGLTASSQIINQNR